MKRLFTFLFFLTAALTFSAASAEATVQSVIGNGGFEDLFGGSNNWDNTANRGIVFGSGGAPEGNHFLRLDESLTGVGSAGTFTFQSFSPVNPGHLVSFSGLVRVNSLDGGKAAQLRIEFRDDAGTLISDSIAQLTATTSGFVRISTSATAPAGTGQAIFTIRIQPATVGGGSQADFDVVEGTASQTPIVLEAAGGGGIRHGGEISAVNVRLLNTSANTISNVEVVAEASAGLDILADRGSLDGNHVNQREGSVIFLIGHLNRSQESVLSFPVLVGTGASGGKRYELTLFARSGGATLSGTFHVVFVIEPDPLFDEGTVLGKVFDDRNEDGEQTKGEVGVPRVRLYTEYGASLVTDDQGQFHLPAVKPGRHILKIDGHTLPQGTTFVTEESLLIKTTPGLLNKVHFAVHLPDSALPEEFRKDLQIWVTQGIDLTQPQLQVTMEPDLLKVGLGRMEREATFRLKNNYGEYVKRWEVAIFDEMGQKVWSGVGAGQPPSQISWNGMADNGDLIGPGIYAYRFIARDSQDHEDWTPLQFFRVMNKADVLEGNKEGFDIPATGSFNINRQAKRTIPLVAKPTLRIFGKTQPNRRVRVNEIPVEVGPGGEFEQEIFVKPGDKKIVVQATSPTGDTVTVEDKITVKESYFFLVALGEDELGLNAMKGNLETVGRNDAFHDDFYEQGRLSYYLKAKVKGKFLVKSRYDTGDARSELFTHLDSDSYYPVYGDYSQIDYEGQDTKERFFILVEMDRSFLKWGSFQTDFQETELGRYDRTLSGLKIHHESLSTTVYGDAKKGFSLFWAKPDTVADHNEFRATGGSLYYLQNRNLVQGSEKVRVEIRDKIQDIPLESRDLVAGKDYEIDDKQGRILLKSPLSSISASETIISNDILDGNPVFLVVDYEYESFQIFKNTAGGLRAYTNVGGHVRIGGTAVEEQRANQDYDLRAVDTVIRAGRNTKVTMEYAEAKLQQVSQSQSFDGGLSFHTQGPIKGRRPREKAYLIKAESKPIQPLELSGYLQDVEPGFSIDRIKSQEGFRKYGIQTKYKFTDSFYILGRHDSTEVVAQLRPLSLFGFSSAFEKLRSSTFQAVFDRGKWHTKGEYLHQYLNVPLTNRNDSFFSQVPFGNAFGVRLARDVTDWLTPYTRGQLSFTGKHNYQIGGGAEVKLGDRGKMYFEEMVGNVGDASLLGVSYQQDQKTTSYASIKSRDLGLGRRDVATTIGSSHQLSERSRFYTEREYSTYRGDLPLGFGPTFVGNEGPSGIHNSDIYGYETRFSDRWNLGLRFERRHLDAEDFRTLGDLALNDLVRTNTFNTLSSSLGYENPKKWKWQSSLELRLEPDAPEIQQWLTQNLAEWKINQDLSFLGRLNFGTSRFLEPGQEGGHFTELNTGLAYRPVDSDRWSWLARYTLLDELAPSAQFGQTTGDLGIPVDERAHIFAIEGGYDLTRFLQIIEKGAIRLGSVETQGTDRTSLDTFLWINRLNYHITRKWDISAEYRMLFQYDAASSLLHGPLVEIDREFYDYVRLGIGYNFTDFDDDLRKMNSYTRSGFFVRLTGKV